MKKVKIKEVKAVKDIEDLSYLYSLFNDARRIETHNKYHQLLQENTEKKALSIMKTELIDKIRYEEYLSNPKKKQKYDRLAKLLESL